ncbi:MAG: purine-nucleoside phosphorylase [Bacteroidota bacterium]
MLSVAEIREQIQTTTTFLKGRFKNKPTVGIILGTGLGRLANEIDAEIIIPYEEIPNFPHSTVESHKGKLIIGTLGGKQVIAMQGRFHYYEGYSMQQITFPVRVMKSLGVETLVVSNACGAMNPLFKKGDVMLMTDHINLLGDNPLIGVNDNELGPRFPDMSEPYSQRLLKLAEEIAIDLKIKVQKGVYVAVAGPNLETRAEYRFLRTIGADVVGMSTVPENIVARHMNMEVLGVSIITDECFPDSLKAVTLAEVLEAAALAEPKMTELLKEFIAQL